MAEPEIRVRVVPRDGRPGELSGRALVENLVNRLDELGDSITEIGRKLGARIAAENAAQPDGPSWSMAEAEVRFSLDLEAEAGVIVSRASAAAGFEVSMKWIRN